jgi:hypothetical protein
MNRLKVSSQSQAACMGTSLFWIVNSPVEMIGLQLQQLLYYAMLSHLPGAGGLHILHYEY